MEPLRPGDLPCKEFASIVFILLRSASISYMYIFTGIDVCLYVWAGGALNGYEDFVWSAYYMPYARVLRKM